MSVLWLFISTLLSIGILYVFDNYIYDKAYYQIYYLIMFFWARNMILIQLYFITKQKYKVFNRGTNTYLLSFILYIVLSKLIDVKS